jgi:protein-disulfide isomerase
MKHLVISLSVSFVFFSVPCFSQNSSDKPLAMVAGQPVSEQEVLDTIGPQQVMQWRNEEYEAKSRALESIIRHRVVEMEAKKRNISPEKLIDQEVDSKVSDPTEGEIQAYFLGQNRQGAKLEDVKDQIRKTLKQVKIIAARQAYADSLRHNVEVSVLLRPPSIDVSYDPTRVKGDPKAPVTIVEFSDFQCPFCKKTESVLSALLEKYRGKVKLAYLDFPLKEIHPRAESAAEAARCAGEQGKFWEFHDSLFADPSKLDETDLIERARTLGLKEEPFRTCVASGKYQSSVNADREAGIKAGVAGTPGFFINGVFLSGAQSQAEFEKIIDGQLSFAEHHSIP